jgi:hypothetical protein
MMDRFAVAAESLHYARQAFSPDGGHALPTASTPAAKPTCTGSVYKHHVRDQAVVHTCSVSVLD